MTAFFVKQTTFYTSATRPLLKKVHNMYFNCSILVCFTMKDFRELLKCINLDEISEDEIKTFGKKGYLCFNLFESLMHCIHVTSIVRKSKLYSLQALKWRKDLVAMSGSGPGYMQRVIITPYIHSMIFHVPEMIRRHGSLRHFSGQDIFIT